MSLLARLLLVICSVFLPAAGLYAHGDLHEQIEAVSRRIEKSPSAELYLKRGELRRAHEEYKAALEDYERAEALDPKLKVVHLVRGRTLFESGRAAEAVEPLTKFIELQGENPAAFLHRARVFARLSRYDKAAADYDRLIELSPEAQPDYYMERAAVLRSAGQAAKAFEGLEQGIRKLGSLVTLETEALDLEVALERYDAALARVDRLMATAQRKETWQERKAEILTHAGRRDEARKAYDDALASVAALPQRLRSRRATQDLERRLKTALAALGEERSSPRNP